jgi:Mg2+ and Co2+ transporter CorA
MNFEIIPELHMQHGYLYFWLLALALVGGLLYLMRRNKLL